MKELSKNINYKKLVDTIGSTYTDAKQNVANAINVEMLNAYWNIGKNIIEFEQEGNLKATYGAKLLENLSKDLKNQHGRGFSRSNLNYMRTFFIKYPIRETVSHKLSWSHYFELLKIEELRNRVKEIIEK